VRKVLFAVALFIAFGILTFPSNAQVSLLAVGSLTSSSAGPDQDLSGLTNTLESGVPANLLGGFGSGIAWGIRLSNDGQFVYTSDEYGPYVNEFFRATGQRVRSFRRRRSGCQ
jgi:hypothetical protein